MRTLLTVSLTTAMMAFCGVAHAGQIWTDGNGDGLPDSGTLLAAPSTNVTVGVWIDAQSFNWTNFLAYVEWPAGCFTYVSASYAWIDPNFPIDDFSHPNGVGFGGSGYNQGGVDLIGWVTLHVESLAPCCVTPIIDPYNPYYVFSQLGAGSAYMLFSTNPGTCYNDDGPGTGACCFCDFSCQVITEAECVAQGGLYFGDGSNCNPPPCDYGLAPCCLPDGSCEEIFPPDCGGIVGDPCTSCDTFVCPPPPTGACCLPNGTCVITTINDCEANGGVFAGFGTDCTACDITGVESKTWGKIKGLFR
jgi:hypothetical protein